jgi:hypothetical protein
LTASSRTPPGSRRGSSAEGGPPATAGEALGRAREHGRAAAAELLLCLESLLDAASLAASGAPAAAGALAPLARTLSGLASDLGRDTRGTDSLLAALTHALDAEIARWEARSLEDPDARAVLRAFLGMREILWELGLRRPEAPAREPGRPARGPARPAPAPRPRRVERVRVEGA